MDTRRTFVFGAGGVLASHAVARKASANDKVRLAVIGINGRGWDHVQGFMKLPDAEVAMLCDVDSAVLERRATQFASTFGRPVKTEKDMRKVFENKEIDAVTIATPNHWHALATIWACQAGKDVYVEKPGAHNVFEGRKMVEAAHKYKRMVQHGVQLRSSEAVREGVDLLRKGIIGKVYMSRGLVYRWRPSIGKKPNEPVPPGLDWDMWQGPAQQREFSRRLVHYNWHWHWDYGNGDVGNQGTHETDMCLWGLGTGLPERITSMGDKFLWDDDKETPELQTSLYHYPKEKKMIQFEVRHWCTNEEQGVGVGNIFYGSEGYMLIRNYDAYEVYLGQKREPGPKRKAGGDHFANFIKAVRSRNPADLNAPVETAHAASALAHLGNIACRTGRVLTFDPKTEKFIGDKEADKLLTRKYRPPYVVPDKV
ncbi:MAG TPA: Gfo/Idh/MocA family oxidoreductase [Bryobacteraceae bacterium]|nr:Gfo/Idh/MocA family oxidoreductase [Bryobacteraceae bacterium]